MSFLETHGTEIVGYLAMLLLLISFLMKDIRRLRKLNTVACALFVAYGFMLATSWPIIISNASIMGINIYYLFLKKK
ncbi:YgjV family protein [Flavobacteriaceae bacterium]|nr:YgjV family protein [Flavobacteriaceae bacterium]MDB9954619.1 YgjV family protein [Flavobacteriaceae bacterium]MDC1265602.1 YgjV family protein [Flavobacteriaceae bacterium]